MYGCPSSCMSPQSCPVVSAFLASSPISPLFCQNKGVETGGSGTYTRKAEASPEPPPPSGCCLQYTYPGPRARIIQFHPLLNLPHQASCASISWWIPLPSSLMSIPSLPFSTNSASAQAVFRPCRSWCKSLSSTQPTDWEF